MSVEDADAILRSFVGVAGAVGGLFFILRMAVSYQRDFTDQYARRVQEQDDRIDDLETEIVQLRRQVNECGQREARLRYALIQAGVVLDPD